ncbi:perforin-1-like isoform X2 [Phycodurus eques]|uniref:perforin-1-like isoform X2 n=1 Tax=Phycodurus eques TaxID=693459 RepID=UPI002ACD5AE9|nr:perforin-1-like isoform X2 [Phycodurus eques]
MCTVSVSELTGTPASCCPRVPPPHSHTPSPVMKKQKLSNYNPLEDHYHPPPHHKILTYKQVYGLTHASSIFYTASAVGSAKKTTVNRTHQSCTAGSPKECLRADFAPGTNLAGEGFDITEMKRKGAFVLDMNRWEHKDKTCTLCNNPFLENAKQKLPLSVEDWRAKQSCNSKVSSTLHRSSEALVNSISSTVENNWKHSLELHLQDYGGKFMLAGTQSKIAEYAMEKTKRDKFSFTSQKITCEYYSYRVSSKTRLRRDFQKALKDLPKTYSPQYKQRFYRLIDNFGTHYITKAVTSIKQCQASLRDLSVEEVNMCLEAEASVTIKATYEAQGKHCKKDIDKTESKNAFSSLFNDRSTDIKGGHTTEMDLLFSADKDPSAYKEWLSTLHRYPDIISYSLESLHELLPINSSVRKNLRSAISHYILERALMRNCSGPCLAGIKSESQDPCACQCHNELAVNLDCCPTRRGMARVIITVQRASGLWGDHSTATDGYVKVIFNKREQLSPVIYNNNNPHWGTVVDLGAQDLSAAPKVTFEVWDQDSGWDDDLLGKCQLVLTAGAQMDVCALHDGKLFYKWEVECAPSLGGRSCADYKPSPMSPSLMSVYVSRHAHRVPRAALLRMGVFANSSSAKSNQSHRGPLNKRV